MPGLLKDSLVKHETRYGLRKQLCLNIPIPKTDMVKKSIQYMSSVLWNKLGNEMRMNSSLDNFKRLIKKLPPELLLLSVIINEAFHRRCLLAYSH